MSNLLLIFRWNKSFLLTSAHSFPCSSDYRITFSCAFSLSRSRCLSTSALLASQLPSQSEKVYTEQFLVYSVRSPAGDQPFQKLNDLLYLLDPKGVRISDRGCNVLHNVALDISPFTVTVSGIALSSEIDGKNSIAPEDISSKTD